MRAIRRSVLVSLSVVFAPKLLLAQSVAARERAAADSVAKVIENVRSQNGLPKLRRIRDKHLRADACRRAIRGEKLRDRNATPFGPSEKVGTLDTLWYSTLDPNQPPPELLEWARGPDRRYEQPHRFAVGVCLTGMSGSAEQRYWIDVGTYMSAIRSILNMPTWD